MSWSGGRDGLLDSQYRGRLVARQLNDSHILTRASFAFRDFPPYSFPETFSVLRRFAEHMNGKADAMEDAVIGAWELQSQPVGTMHGSRPEEAPATLRSLARDDAG